MKKIITGLIMGLCLISLIGVVSGKWGTEGWDIDVQNVEFPKTVNKGNILPVSVSVHNSGGRTGTFCIFMSVQKPDGGKIYPSNTMVVDIPANQVKTVPLNWRVTESPGKYLINIDIYDPRACKGGTSSAHMFDTTGFVYSFEIKESYDGNTKDYIIVGLLIIIILILIFKK